MATNEQRIGDLVSIDNPLNDAHEDGLKTYKFALTTAGAAYGPIDVGRYKVRVESGDNSKYVTFRTQDANTPTTVNDADADGEVVSEIFGDEAEFLRIKAGRQYLIAKASSALNLHLIPVGK